jgi:ketosteroid isomerase-like protein
MNVAAAARLWSATWERAWPVKDIEAITALYADQAAYRAMAFREPDLGLSAVRGYLTRTFAAETDISCRFGEPIVTGDRAAVEWWASWTEDGQPVTMAGVTVLRFGSDGRVADHRDYWNQSATHSAPFAGWLTTAESE